TAERLFAEKGYDATSLREIISAAGVNLAAIHYHFGSKEEMLDELIRRKAAPLNEQRLALLDQVEVEAGPSQLTVESVLRAFLLPMCIAQRHPQFVRLMGRIHAEGMMPDIMRRHFQTVVVRFLAALRRALPALPEQELAWRVHFMIGAMAHAMCVSPALPAATPLDFPGRIERLIAFLSAGFRAPLAPAPLPPEKSENIEVTP